VLIPFCVHMRVALDVRPARREVDPFAKAPEALALWSREFFREVASRVWVVWEPHPTFFGIAVVPAPGGRFLTDTEPSP
jgi:hypothetical protein